jgi:two-component system sensor histidine kinase YesM
MKVMANKSRKKAVRSKIQFQLILLYLGILLAITFGFYIYIDNNIFAKMQDDVIDNMEFTVEGLSQQVETYFDNSDEVMTNIIFQGTLENYMKELNSKSDLTEIEKLNYDRKFDDLIAGMMTFSIVPTSRMVIYNRDRTYEYHYNYVTVSNLNQVMDSKQEQQYLESNNRIICCQKSWTSDSRTNVFSIIRQITDLRSDKLGYIELQLNYNALDNLCSFQNGRQTYLINQSGQMIYPDKNAGSDELLFLKQITDKNSGVIRQGTDCFVWRRIRPYDMIVVIKQSESGLFGTIRVLNRTTVLILLLFAGISIPVIYYSLFRMLKPIKDLTQQMAKINYGSMELQVKSKDTYDEVWILQNTFSDMLQRIMKSAEKEISFQKEQERMKYETLQKQIAPHFIHNTLYVISIAAQENRKEDVVVMCKELSDILRYSMNMQNMTVLFREEVEYIKNYLKIQEENYGTDLQYSIRIDEIWNEKKVPRMLLQPFVENCFKHGFSGREAPYRLSITGYENSDLLYLVISDNGVGISEETIRKIYDKLNAEAGQDNEKMDSLGVVNTILRLKYMYKDSASVLIEREENGGTRVTIRLNKI